MPIFPPLLREPRTGGERSAMASPRSNRATQLCGVPLSRARCSPVALRHDSRRRQESAERGCTRSETVAAERTVRRCFSSSHRHGKGRWSDERRQPGASQTCVENARKMVFRHMFSTQVSASGELVATVTPGAIWHVFADAIWHGAVCEASSVAARWRHDSWRDGIRGRTAGEACLEPPVLWVLRKRIADGASRIIGR